MQTVLKAQINETDRNDVHGIAEMMPRTIGPQPATSSGHCHAYQSEHASQSGLCAAQIWPSAVLVVYNHRNLRFYIKSGLGPGS